MDYPKDHWIDAACVGESGLGVDLDPDMQILKIKAMGYGNRQMCQTDRYGFPKAHRARSKLSHGGFSTGDIASANVPKGKYAGKYRCGRVTTRKTTSFKFTDNKTGIAYGFHYKYLTRIFSKDGYFYKF
jgi:hypothetical protein